MVVVVVVVVTAVTAVMAVTGSQMLMYRVLIRNVASRSLIVMRGLPGESRKRSKGATPRLRTLRSPTLLTLSWGYGCTMRGRVSVKPVNEGRKDPGESPNMA